MLFKRKNTLSFGAKILQFFQTWLSWTALKRSLLYIKHRILRLPHNSHQIAMGLASGFSVSWTPTWGLHILQCFVFCKIFRANFLSALLGSLFGNPWTFPILIWVSYLVGTFVTDITGMDRLFDMKAGDSFIKEEGFGMTKFLPTLIGGYIMAILTFPIFYYSFYYLIEGARKTRASFGHRRTRNKDGR